MEMTTHLKCQKMMWRLAMKMLIREKGDIQRKRYAVRFINRNEHHDNVKEMWQRAEGLEICPGAAQQSTKEHFNTNMIPNTKLYNLSENELLEVPETLLLVATQDRIIQV